MKNLLLIIDTMCEIKRYTKNRVILVKLTVPLAGRIPIPDIKPTAKITVVIMINRSEKEKHI